MKIVIIDNYDSFVYNLSHAIKELGAEVTVKRNDQFRLEELEEFDKILVRGFRENPACCWMSSAGTPERNRYWGSAWANRPSAKCTEEN